ncbi:hypothetical protein Fmac_022214 [Flemingia macrophylla]|uniref:FAR1 domain-containing protein n=1 Tax=Flemingia macrophylla TaxID=520843 RepID=A0ABD1LZE6_9FABA
MDTKVKMDDLMKDNGGDIHVNVRHASEAMTLDSERSEEDVCEENLSDDDAESEDDGNTTPGFKTLMDLTEEEINAMEFGSESYAYKFYYAYGKCHGFGIRKDEVRYDENGKMVMRQFLCSKAGLRDKKHFMRDDRKREHRSLTRTNCKAKLRVRLDSKTCK